MLVYQLVEGLLDESVAQRLLAYTGHEQGSCFGKRGIDYIRQKISAFNSSSRGMTIFTLIDLMDTGMECSPRVVREWLPRRERGMIFRVVVNEIESWLIADKGGLATFLGVSESRVPEDPEGISDPKNFLVTLAGYSRKRRIREAIVPNLSGATVGPLYNSVMKSFVVDMWDIDEARRRCVSLNSCIEALEVIR